jgi:hypothetical protein
MYSFVLITEFAGDTSALASQITPTWLNRCAMAITQQLNNHVAKYWPDAIGAVCRVGTKDNLGPGEIAFAIISTLPNAPGDVAYHDTTGADVPIAFIAIDTCQTLNDVSTAISHECIETVGNPFCNLFATDSAGMDWARELCDAVESNWYGIDLMDGQPAVNVSDFLTPAFFGPTADGPYNFCATLPANSNQASIPISAPFITAAGGYQIQKQSGQETQVQAMEGSKKGAKVKSGKHHWNSRPARIGVKAA